MGSTPHRRRVAEAGAELTFKDGKLGFDYGAGAAVGVGGKVGGEVSVDVSKPAKTVAKATKKASKSAKKASKSAKKKLKKLFKSKTRTDAKDRLKNNFVHFLALTLPSPRGRGVRGRSYS